jgi:hypothetical protein
VAFWSKTLFPWAMKIRSTGVKVEREREREREREMREAAAACKNKSCLFRRLIFSRRRQGVFFAIIIIQ